MEKLTEDDIISILADKQILDFEMESNSQDFPVFFIDLNKNTCVIIELDTRLIHPKYKMYFDGGQSDYEWTGSTSEELRDDLEDLLSIV